MDFPNIKEYLTPRNIAIAGGVLSLIAYTVGRRGTNKYKNQLTEKDRKYEVLEKEKSDLEKKLTESREKYDEKKKDLEDNVKNIYTEEIKDLTTKLNEKDAEKTKALGELETTLTQKYNENKGKELQSEKTAYNDKMSALLTMELEIKKKEEMMKEFSINTPEKLRNYNEKMVNYYEAIYKDLKANPKLIERREEFRRDLVDKFINKNGANHIMTEEEKLGIQRTVDSKYPMDFNVVIPVIPEELKKSIEWFKNNYKA